MLLHRYRLFAQVSLVLNRVFAQWQRQWHAHEKKSINDANIRALFREYWKKELLSHGAYLFGFRLDVYRRFLLNEFANLNLEKRQHGPLMTRNHNRLFSFRR